MLEERPSLKKSNLSDKELSRSMRILRDEHIEHIFKQPLNFTLQWVAKLLYSNDFYQVNLFYSYFSKNL